MTVNPQKTPHQAKSRFLLFCAIACGFYLVFSFALQHVFADPPGSPFTPGETLDPGCAPTSTNCTVQPPLFSTTTLPVGGVLFDNDTSGTITANTSLLYLNTTNGNFGVGTSAPYSDLSVAGMPVQGSTSTLVLLGNNYITGGNASGTFLGANAPSGYNGDFVNFEVNSSSQFDVSSSGVVTLNAAQINSDFNLGTTTNPAGDILYVATATPIFSVANSGFVGIGTSSPYSAFSVAGLPVQSTTSTLVLLGNNYITGGNASGTFLGANIVSGSKQDFINFEVNSSTKFQLGANGNVTTTNVTITGVASAQCLGTNASGTIASVGCGGGNVFANSTSSIVANQFMTWATSGSSTVSATSSLYETSAGDIIIGSATWPFAATSTGLWAYGNASSGQGDIDVGDATGGNTGLLALDQTSNNGNFYSYMEGNAYFNASGSTWNAIDHNKDGWIFSLIESKTGATGGSSWDLYHLASSSGAYTVGNPAIMVAPDGQTIIDPNSNTPGIIKSTLDVGGNASIGSYAGNGGAAAPSNGLIVSGDTAIGTSTDNGKLNVVGAFNQSGGLVSLASTTVLGNVTTTNLSITSQLSSVLYANGSGAVGALGIGNGLTLSGGSLSLAQCGCTSGSFTVTTSTVTYAEQLNATTTVVNVQGTAASTSVYKYTVPGNTLGTAGGFIQVTMFGTLKVPTTHGIGWLMYYGGQLVASSTSANITASANPAGWTAQFNLSNASGTTNNQIGNYIATIGTASSTAVGTTLQAGGVVSIDSTSNQTLEIDVRLSSATAESSTVNSVQTEYYGATTTVVSNVTGGVGTSATSVDYYFPYYTSTSTLSATSTIFISSSTGNLSIGTTTTSSAMLYVNGVVDAGGGFYGQCLSSGGFNATTSGSCNMDLAEAYPTIEPTEPGDVVAIPHDATTTDATTTDEDAIPGLAKSRGGDDETVIGVVSTNPGVVFDNGETYIAGDNESLTTSTEAVIALAGRVPVKVSAENGPINPGDLLAASTIEPGVAVKAIGPGMVIGEALQAYSGDDGADADTSSTATSTPEILVFVNPHWAPGNDDASSTMVGIPAVISNGDQSVLAEVTQYVQAALSNMGIFVSDGIATLKGIVVDRVTTNLLCIQETCITSNQLQGLLQNQTGSQTPPPASTPVAPPTPMPTPVITPTSTATSTPSDDDTNPTSTDDTVDTSTTSTDVTSASTTSTDPSSTLPVVPSTPTSTPTSTPPQVDTSTDTSTDASTTPPATPPPSTPSSTSDNSGT